MLQHMLLEEQIRTSVTGPDKRDEFRQILEALPSWRLIDEQKEKVLEGLLLREQIGTTAVGDGIAFPHVTTDQVEQPVVMLGLSREGIDFDALDGGRVHLFFVLLLPDNGESSEVKCRILRQARKIFSDRFLVERLSQTETSEEAYNFMTLVVDELKPASKVKVV